MGLRQCVRLDHFYPISEKKNAFAPPFRVYERKNTQKRLKKAKIEERGGFGFSIPRLTDGYRFHVCQNG